MHSVAFNPTVQKAMGKSLGFPWFPWFPGAGKLGDQCRLRQVWHLRPLDVHVAETVEAAEQELPVAWMTIT